MTTALPGAIEREPFAPGGDEDVATELLRLPPHGRYELWVGRNDSPLPGVDLESDVKVDGLPVLGAPVVDVATVGEPKPGGPFVGT